MIQKREKFWAFIFIILFLDVAVLSNSVVGEESNAFLMKKESTNQLLSYSQRYSWTNPEILLSQRAELDPSCEFLLSYEGTSLDLRYTLASYMSRLMCNDIPIIYLMSNIISKIFNGEISEYHFGYLISSGNEWAILIEHGFQLLISNTTNKYIHDLSLQYKTVYLGSCGSKIYSKYYKNIQGFDIDLTVKDLVDYLSIHLRYSYTDYKTLVNSELAPFTLDVIPQNRFSLNPSVQVGLAMVAAANALLGWNVLSIKYVDLLPGIQISGSGSYGVAHINSKSTSPFITNPLLDEVLLSSDVWFLFKKPYSDAHHCLVVLKEDPVSSHVRMAGVLIGLPYQKPLAISLRYTIRSAEIYLDLDDPDNTNKAPNYDYFESHWGWIQDVYYRHNYHKPTKIITAPYDIDEVPFENYIGYGDPYEETADDIITIIDDDDDEGDLPEWLQKIADWDARGWAIAVIITIIAIVLLAIIISSVLTGGIATIVELIAGMLSAPLIAAIFILLGDLFKPITANSSYNAILIDLEEEYPTGYPLEYDTDNWIASFYDDDNDGISNDIEQKFFELYCEETYVNGTETIYEFTGPCGSSEIDLSEIINEKTWMDPTSDYDNDGLYTITEVIYKCNPFKSDTDNDNITDSAELSFTGGERNITVTLTDYDRDGYLDNQTIISQGNITMLSNPILYDSDFDGLSDSKENYFGTNAFNPDSDNDTMLDGWEVFTTVVPWDINFEYSLEEYNNVVNPLYAPTNPSNWASMDIDKDGLNNTMESKYFTNPFYNDTDHDGLLDEWEINNGFDPTNPYDAEYDIDEDGLTTTEEQTIYGTLWNVSDTDSDGWSDGYEVNVSSTNPLLADTDSDGLLDKEEFTYWTAIHGVSNSTAYAYCSDPDIDNDGLLDGEEIYTYNTDPNNWDTDGDYLPDKWEIEHGYSPTNQDSDGDGTLDLNEDVDGDGLTVFEEMTYGTSDTSDDTDNDCIPDDEEIHIYETDPLNGDTDGDGMLEYWEITHGLDPLVQDSTADPDMDGVNNYIESVLGLDPFNADSDGDDMPDGWEIYYGLDPAVADSLGDPDNDGLTNSDEYTYGTNPQNTDSDSDGMPDGWEAAHGLDPCVDDTTSDLDSDGLTNINEYLKNCDPQDTDSDNDGWTDGFEVSTSGTDPTKADTDSDSKTDKAEFLYWKTRGKSDATAYSYCKIADVDNDGLKDGVEINYGLDPLDNDMDNDGLLDGLEVGTYHTDPDDPDSDNDGYTDLYEIINGTDPNDASDYPGGGGGFEWW